jgi:diguanylate cyclase (GGDEF)-like protein
MEQRRTSVPQAKSTQSANTLEKLRREKFLLRQELDMFHHVMEGMRLDISLEELLKLIVRAVTKGLGYDRAAIFLPTHDGTLLERAVGINQKGQFEIGADEHSQHPISCVRGFSILSDIYNGYKDFFYSNNVLKRFPGAKQNVVQGVTCNANIPMHVRKGQIVGVLAVDNLFSHRKLKKSDVESLLNFATQAGLVMESARMHDRVKTLSMTDELTGLFNRRNFDQNFPRELLRCQRYERECSLLYVDMDHFKHVNDTYGHAAGDEVLKFVALMLRGAVRNIDTISRIGGDEFAVLLPETGPRDAIGVAQRLVYRLASTPPPLEVMKKAGESVTLSVGLASYPKDGLSPDELMAKADSYLYKAKSSGRNRVATESTESKEDPPSK